MHDDDFERSPAEPRRPQALSLEDQKRNAAARAYDEQQKLNRETAARAFLQTSEQFGSMLAAYNIDDEHTKKFIIDAAAKDIAKAHTKAELEPKDLGRLIGAAVAKGLEQEKLERERFAAKEARAGGEPPLPQRQTQIDQNTRNFFERGEQRSERQNQTAQPLGKYRELEGLSRGDDVSREQREASDRRQAIDPATRAASDRGRPLTAGEVKETWRDAAKETSAVDRVARGDERPREDRGGQSDRGGGRGGRTR